MSTSFDVYPHKREIPTFAALLERSTAELHRYLASVDIDARPAIHVELRRSDHSLVPFFLMDEARWSNDLYAWFTVENVPGGTDAYYDERVERIQQFWKNELQSGSKYQAFADRIGRAMKVGHAWWFRRSAGQSAVVSVTYGLIAASLAALTEGFIHSTDGAWDWNLLPALPEDFFRLYFRPDLSIWPENRNWVAESIARLANELKT